MRVSIIIPFFNQASTLGWTIQSAIRQTYQDIEIIIVDDGSDEAARHVAQEVAATRYLVKEDGTLEGWYDQGDDSLSYATVIRREKNAGVVAARNLAVYAEAAEQNFPDWETWRRDAAKPSLNPICTGDMLLFLDADDWIEPTFLEKTVPLIGYNIGIVSTDMHVFSDNSDSIVRTQPATLETIKQGNTIPICSLIRREAFIEAGGFKENTHEDWNLWIDILKRDWVHKVVSEPLFHYRHHIGSSRSTELAKQHEEMFANMKRLHPDIWQ